MPFSVEKNNIKYSLVDYKKEYKQEEKYLINSEFSDFPAFIEDFSDDSSLNFMNIERN